MLLFPYINIISITKLSNYFKRRPCYTKVPYIFPDFIDFQIFAAQINQIKEANLYSLV